MFLDSTPSNLPSCSRFLASTAVTLPSRSTPISVVIESIWSCKYDSADLALSSSAASLDSKSDISDSNIPTWSLISDTPDSTSTILDSSKESSSFLEFISAARFCSNSSILNLAESNLPSCSTFLASTESNRPSCSTFLDSTSSNLPSCSTFLDSTEFNLPSCSMFLDSTPSNLPSCSTFLASTESSLSSAESSRPSCSIFLSSISSNLVKTELNCPAIVAAKFGSLARASASSLRVSRNSGAPFIKFSIAMSV